MHIFHVGQKVGWSNEPLQVAWRKNASTTHPICNVIIMTIQKIIDIPDSCISHYHRTPLNKVHPQWIILEEENDKHEWLGTWFIPIHQTTFELSAD